MKYMKLPYIALAMAVMSMTSCGHGHSGTEDEHAGHNHDHAGDLSAETVEDGEKGHSEDEGLILLDTDNLSRLGVVSEEIQPGVFSNVIKVSGEIAAMPGSDGIVAVRQGGIVRLAPGISEGVSVGAGRTVATVSAKGMAGGDPNESARVAYAAAKRELDRITPLHKEGIVTTRDYNAALQRVEEARAAIGGGSGGASAATAPVAGVITSIDVVDGQYVEPGQTIATVSSNNALTLRADLPESSAGMLAGITGARFRPSYSAEVIDVLASGGKMISRPSVSSAGGGYIPVYFSLPKGKDDLIGGTYCEVYLLGAEREGVLTVAEEAVSEQQGNYFVYVEHSPGHYRKQPVTVGAGDGSRREILAGLHPGDKVVSKGMTFVKLAETSGAVPEGHSHSH